MKMFKHFTAFTTMTLTAAMLLSGCSGSKSTSAASSTTADASDAASGEEVLKIGVECAYPPFNWVQNEETTASGKEAEPIVGTKQYAYGYDIAMAQKIAEELGVDLEVHKSEWSSIGMGLDAGDYDAIISGMGATKARAENYNFTDPYYYRTNCLVVQKGSGLEDVKGLSDLAGKNVKLTTQLGTGWVDLLDQVPDGVKDANYETTSECFMAVSNGVADVCVVDLPTARAALLTNPDLAIVELADDDKFVGDDEMTNICIATRKDDEETTKKMAEVLKKLNWTEKEDMDALMDEVFKDVPSNN